jgi:GAF domain-containing protein
MGEKSTVGNPAGASDRYFLRSDATTTQDPLRRSLLSLQHLIPDDMCMKGMLTQVAALATCAIPGAEGAGLTLLEKDRPDVLVATAQFVSDVDAIQYGIGEGPCITAAKDGTTVRCDSLGSDDRWPNFGPRVASLGIHSALSLPLITPKGSVIGAMNIYARHRRSFTPASAQIGESFAESAAIAVYNALVLAQAKDLAARLRTVLVSRSVIDRAIGIIMATQGSNDDDALLTLQDLTGNRPDLLIDVAQSVIDGAAHPARERHHNT